MARAVIRRAAAQGQELHISLIALSELIWVLRSAPYRFSREALSDVLDKLLEASVFRIQDQDLVRSAVAEYRQSRADFADFLIGQLDRREGCAETWTFDQKLAREDGFSLPD